MRACGNGYGVRGSLHLGLANTRHILHGRGHRARGHGAFAIAFSPASPSSRASSAAPRSKSRASPNRCAPSAASSDASCRATSGEPPLKGAATLWNPIICTMVRPHARPAYFQPR
eukprot:265373-Prymnesium_polylepis.1